MLRLAWTATLSFSALPLRLSFIGAGVMTLVALEETIRALVVHFSGQTVPGWTSLMVIVCLSNAALMISVGILGEYVGRVYEEGKERPLYLVADTWNLTQPATNERTERIQTIGAADEIISHRLTDGQLWTSAETSDSPHHSATKEVKVRR